MNNALQLQLSSLGHRVLSSEGQPDVSSLASHTQGLPMSSTMTAAHRASRDNAFSIADTDAKSSSSGEDSKSRTQRGSDSGSGNDDVVSVMTRRRKGVECKVLITYEILAQHFHESLDAVAEKLMISKTSIKAACRRLGVAKWPYQHRGPRKSRSKNSNETEGSSAGDSSESGRVEGSKDGYEGSKDEGSKDGSEGSKDGSEAASSKDAPSKDDRDNAKGSDMSDDDDSDSSTHNSDEEDEGDDEPAEDARADAREREDKTEDLKAVFHAILSREGDARPAPAKRRRVEDGVPPPPLPTVPPTHVPTVHPLC